MRHRFEKLLDKADVRINGDRPWDLLVYNDNLYRRVLLGGSLALGETFMDDWWDSHQLDGFFTRLLQVRLDKAVWSNARQLDSLRATLFNLQKGSRAYQIGKHHYDIGNDLYRCMLDRRMIYSCGYWTAATTLDEAQEAKIRLVAAKLGLEKGMRVLDIGCGWGGTAAYLAEHYGVHVVGLTVSEEQARLAKEHCADLPVDIRLQDYRSLNDRFDRILSIGMFEHVGHKNYQTFMKVVKSNLVPDGLFLLHTIGHLQSATTTDPWIHRYIFPNSMLPSAKQITSAVEGLFVIEDWHNFGSHYDQTLQAWVKNFQESWGQLRNTYDERFYRMWLYYLQASSGAFRARVNQLWQIVLSPHGVPGGYTAPRYRSDITMPE